jgi:pimeloyl-ACP methyl ester carboxylesterase
VGIAQDRLVLSLEFRGRGQSEYSAKPNEYTPFTEMLDTFAFLDSQGVDRAAVIGTSRGGIVAMLMGVARPAALAAVVLNDIGPHLEPAGLLRIAGYVSHTPAPNDWDDAVANVRMIHEPSFSGLSDEDWMAVARNLYREVDGRPRTDYDPKLATTLDAVRSSGGHVPDLWPQFESLKHVPVLVTRGENTDILSAETLERMGERHPDLHALTVRDRGHAPFLTEPGVPRAISRLIARAEES